MILFFIIHLPAFFMRQCMFKKLNISLILLYLAQSEALADKKGWFRSQMHRKSGILQAQPAPGFNIIY